MPTLRMTRRHSPNPALARRRAATSPRDADLSALRLVPVPDTGPPFDGDPSTGTPTAAPPWPSARAGATSVRALRTRRRLGSGAAAIPRAAARGTRRARGSGGGQIDGGARPDRGGATGDDWSRQFALLLTEALAGARPIRQILPWTTDRARTHLDKLMPLFSGGQRPRVQRVITSRPTKDAIEMTVVVGVGTRTRALAVRLERVFHPQRGMPRTRTGGTPPQWLCTAIEAA